MRHYCNGWAKKSRKNVSIWKRPFSIKTMHGCTPAQFRWPKLSNWNPNYYNIFHIHRIWHPVTFLFPNLKKWLDGQRFTSNKVIAQTDAYFEDPPKFYFLYGLKNLEKRLEKCIELEGDYVERWKKFT